jgi:hypothetical protein
LSAWAAAALAALTASTFLAAAAGAWVIKIILRLSPEIHIPLLLALVVIIQINSPHLNLVGHLILTQYQLFGLAAALLLVVLILYLG